MFIANAQPFVKHKVSRPFRSCDTSPLKTYVRGIHTSNKGPDPASLPQDDSPD